MGVRGELFSTKVQLQNRTYFFNVKENRLGDLYLNIVESKNRDEGGFERQSVILFAEDLQDFLRGFDESLKVLEKSVREKRRGPPARRERSADEKSDAGRPPRQREGYAPRDGGGGRRRGSTGYEGRNSGERKNEGWRNSRPHRGYAAENEGTGQRRNDYKDTRPSRGGGERPKKRMVVKKK